MGKGQAGQLALVLFEAKANAKRARRSKEKICKRKQNTEVKMVGAAKIQNRSSKKRQSAQFEKGQGVEEATMWYKHA